MGGISYHVASIVFTMFKTRKVIMVVFLLYIHPIYPAPRVLSVL